MSIHDELILELIKPDKWGKPTGYIINSWKVSLQKQ